MLGTLTTSPELYREIESVWEEIIKDQELKDSEFEEKCNIEEMYMPWMNDPIKHNPKPGVYIGWNGFQPWAYDQTKDLTQHFWWCFDECTYYSEECGHDKNGFPNKNPNYIGYPYGLCDDPDQAIEYLKGFVDHPTRTYIIWMYPIEHHPENAGKRGGFRPYKNGKYVGKWKDIIDTHEYLDDCEFPTEFQGFIYAFHAIRIK